MLERTECVIQGGACKDDILASSCLMVFMIEEEDLRSIAGRYYVSRENPLSVSKVVVDPTWLIERKKSIKHAGVCV